jgi:hypothetical protein
MANPNLNVLVVLPAELHEFLTEILYRRIIQKGIEPEELAACGEIWRRLKTAQTIDYSNLGEAEVEALSGSGASINLK